MKIKVCGIIDINDAIEIENKCSVGYFGLIFVGTSKRFVKRISAEDLKKISTKVVGVFSNNSHKYIRKNIQNFNIDIVQLHGKETPRLCLEIYKIKKNIKIIKAISLEKKEDLAIMETYENCSDYYLFDTKNGQNTGGTGKKFDWKWLSEVEIKKPFFIAGGISEKDISDIKKLNLKNLYGIDINSRFEKENYKKDVKKVVSFINNIKNEK